MESNNPTLGNDTLSEKTQSDTEQTTAETQDQTALSADTNTSESASEFVQNAVVLDDVAAEAADETAADELDAPDAAVAEVDEAEDDEAEANQVAAEVADDSFDAEDDEAEDDEAEVDQAAAEVADDSFDTEDDEEADEEVEEDTSAEPELPRFRKGALVDGVVVETSPTEVVLDLGEGTLGVVASRELERMDRTALETLVPGSPVVAYVLKARGADKRPVLSLARAEEESNWRLAEAHHENQEVYFSKVAGYNKGGLIVRFGKVRGFVPASQISRERQQRASGGSPEERWGEMVGEDIAVKVVEIDRSRNRLILSERAAAREWREKQKERLMAQLQVGETRQGRVISLADFGAFVDLGGADGLVHLTELSWKHVTHPREALKVGQVVEVQVISIDRQRKRIGLSMKRQEDDPWQQVTQGYHVGQLVQASVTKLTKFGAFARLVDSPEIEGLVHISELADYRVNHPRDVVLVGDVLTLRIVKIDADQRRLGLSLRQVDSAKYMDHDWQAIVEEIEDEEDDAPATISDEGDFEPSTDDEADYDTVDYDEAGHDEADYDEAGHDEADYDEANHDEDDYGEAGHDEADHDEDD